MAKYLGPQEVDDAVAALLRQQRERPQQQTQTYSCECSDLECCEAVVLSQSQYEALRDRRDLILAPDHVETPDERQRRIAQGLCDDSQALRAQAAHQVARAADIAARMQPTRGD
jgi:hypothetical protein